MTRIPMLKNVSVPGCTSIGSTGARLALAFLLYRLALNAAPATAVTLEVTDLSTDLGIVSGEQIYVPVGGTVTIGSIVTAPPTERVWGLGISYYGYDETLLSAGTMTANPHVFGSVCLAPHELGGIQHLSSPLAASPAFFGPHEGRERVRVLSGALLTFGQEGARYSLANSAGIDGVCGGGDADFRVSFDALAQGTTTITVGTGDDFGGIVWLPDGSTVQASNATVRVTVPEPGIAMGLLIGSSMLVLSDRRRRAAIVC